MAVNQLKKAKEEQKARARARQRRALREQRLERYSQQSADDDLSPGLKALAERTSLEVRTVVPQGQKKLSEVVLEFLDPYLSGDEAEKEFRAIVTLGVLAWNSVLLPRRQQQELRRKNSLELPPPVNEMFEDMMRRRLNHFMHDPRLVVDFEISSTRTGLHLSVAYAMKPPVE
jgi:hypothetical protein